MFTFFSNDNRNVVTNNQKMLYSAIITGSNNQGKRTDLSANTLVSSSGHPITDKGVSVRIWNNTSKEFDLEQYIDDADMISVFSVGIDTDTVVIGSSKSTLDENDLNAVSNAGAVFIYTRSGTLWSLEQKIVAPVRTVDHYFGTTVSISNDRIVVGGSISSLDEFYVYLRTGTVWSLEQTITYPITETAYNLYIDDTVGKILRLSGSTVYVYLRTGTVWSLEQSILSTMNSRYGHIKNNLLIYNSTSQNESKIKFYNGSSWVDEYTFANKLQETYIYDSSNVAVIEVIGTDYFFKHYQKNGTWEVVKEVQIQSFSHGHSPIVSLDVLFTLNTYFYVNEGEKALLMFSDGYEV